MNARIGHTALAAYLLAFLFALTNAILPSAYAAGPSNAAPIVAISSPSTGATFRSPTDITLVALPYDPDGSVTLVEFFNGATKIGSASGAPWQMTWTSVAPGTYSITAKATDNASPAAAGTASAVSVTVLPASTQSPQVVLTSPANCLSVLGPAQLDMRADAYSDNGVQTIEFMADGVVKGTATKPPYKFTWTNVPAGTYQLTARAIDKTGLSAMSNPITVNVTAPPTVTLTSPEGNDQFRVGNAVSFSATATAASGIKRVEFLSSDQVVATATSSPYAGTWTPPSLGSYSITARATDNAGVSATTSPISIGVVTNAAPKVTLISPANGASFNAPVDISVQATATDDVSVAKVEFFYQGVLIDTVIGSGPNYSTFWKNVLPGSYSVTAKATDNEGVSRTSAAANITVRGVAGNIDSPKDGASVTAPYDIQYRVAATNTLIHTVEFYDNAAVFYTLTSDSSSSFSGTMTITSAPVGAHAHKIKVTTTGGAVAFSPEISVNVVPTPTVELSAPLASQFYIAPAFVLLRPNLANFTNQVSRVDYYASGQLVASSATPPFEVFWPNASLGNYGIVAKATDASGRQYSSAQTAIEVGSAPRLTVTSPIGAQVAEDRAYLAGTIRAPVNSAISVNAVPGSIDNQGNWFVENVPLDGGGNTLNIVVSTLDADPLISSISLSSTSLPEYDFVVDAVSVVTPSSVGVRLTHRGGKAFNHAEFDVNGDGATDFTSSTLTDGDVRFSVNVTGSGTLPISVKVLDDAGLAVYSATRHVIAVPQDKQAAFIKDQYLEIMARLRSGDISGAVKRLTTPHQAPLTNMFNAFGTDLSSVVDQIGTVGSVDPHGDIVGLELVRSAKVFPLNFVRDPDGIWRLDGM